MSITTLSPQDVQALVNHAQTAPLRDLGHAMQVHGLLTRFGGWYNGLEDQIKTEVQTVRDEAAKTEESLRAEIADLKSKLGVST